MSSSDQHPIEEKDHKPYLVAQPVPKSVRIASWLIILLGLLVFAFSIYTVLIAIIVGDELLLGFCWLPISILIGGHIYNCGKQMQDGNYSFITGFSALGLAVLLLSAFMCYKNSATTAAAIMVGIILIFFIFPIVVAFLNRKRLL